MVGPPKMRNLALQMRRREQTGRRPRIKRIPPRLVLPFSAVARRDRVALGFSLCGEFLYSYGGENGGAFFIERFDCRCQGRGVRTVAMSKSPRAEISFPLLGDRAVCRASTIGDEASLDTTVLVLHQSPDLAVGSCTAAALASSTESGTARWWWMGLFPAVFDPAIECQDVRQSPSTSNGGAEAAAMGVQFNIPMNEQREPNLQHLYPLRTHRPVAPHTASQRQWMLLLHCGDCLRLLLLSEESRAGARAEAKATGAGKQNASTEEADAWQAAFGCRFQSSGASVAGVQFSPQTGWRGSCSTPLLRVSPLPWQGVDQHCQRSPISSRATASAAGAADSVASAAVEEVGAATVARSGVKRRCGLSPRLRVEAERLFDFDRFLRLALRNVNSLRRNPRGAAAQHRPQNQHRRQQGAEQKSMHELLQCGGEQAPECNYLDGHCSDYMNTTVITGTLQ